MTTISVYRVFDTQGHLLYVGQTSNLVKRLEAHKWISPWGREPYQVTIETAPDRAEAIVMERFAIKAEHPRYNVQHNHTPADYTLGPWLRGQREHIGIGLRAMARKSGYSPGYLSRVERGEKPIPFKTGTRLLVCLGEMQQERAS